MQHVIVVVFAKVNISLFFRELWNHLLSSLDSHVFVLAEDDPPEYDVADRVRQLNEELAKEPTPNSDERRTSIKFKETLVDLVAPPYDYSDDDDEEGRENGDPTGRRVGGGTESQKDDGGEKVLVEHGGKFELISSSDLTAEEKLMYGVEDSSDVVNTVGGRKSVATMKPRPPDVQRPSTASGTSSRQHFHASASKRRPKSAQPCSSDEVFYNFDYVSPYGLSPEQKKCLQRQKQLQERHESEQTRADQEKNESKQRENELAFQAWLSQKRDEHHRQHHDTKKGSPSSENGVSNRMMQNGMLSEFLQLGYLGLNRTNFQHYN